MNRTSGNEKSVSWNDIEPLEQIFDFAGRRSFAQSLRGYCFAKSGRDFRTGLGAEDVPHLRLAPRLVMHTSVVVVRMHLYREFFCSEQKFYKQRKVIDAFKPNLPDLLIGVWEKGFKVS